MNDKVTMRCDKNMPRTIGITLTVVFLWCTSASANEPWLNWNVLPVVENTALGKIWSTRQSQFISAPKLVQEMRTAEYILLGEVHDNPDHHELQAWIISQIAQVNKNHKPAIVMEMIKVDRADDLQNFRRLPDADPANLGNAIGWEKSGWPAWKIYQPIAEAVFKYELPLLPGDPPSKEIREVAKTGLQNLPDIKKNRYALSAKFPVQLHEKLHKEIIASHCDLLPATMLNPMVGVQRFRDAHLARELVNARVDKQAILIAGNGHVRKNRAVPWYLNMLDANTNIVSIMQVEVGDENPISKLLKKNQLGPAQADYIWFTPQLKRPDQCEILRKRFKK